MTNSHKIIIKISSEKLELLKKLGLSPKDVFFKGFEEFLKQKYKEFNLIDEDDEDEEEDEMEWLDLNQLNPQINKIDPFIVDDNEISNN